MADAPRVRLDFPDGCPDCGSRQADLPAALPPIGDDFDWQVRDFDSFRRFMLQELQARFPARRRWTAGDLEVVLVEAFAAVLDQLSDMADRVATDAYLETARRPQSVRRLLEMIGDDPITEARLNRQIGSAGLLDDGTTSTGAVDATGFPQLEQQLAARELEEFWLDHPEAMDAARRAGPSRIRTQRRMVSVDDYASRLEDHPLVLRADARSRWSGTWPTIHVAVILWEQHQLDDVLDHDNADELCRGVNRFHRQHGLTVPSWPSHPSSRAILNGYVEQFRMVGQEVMLQDAVPVGISMSIAIKVASNFFQSEIRNAVRQVLGRGPLGFFAPGRLRFGEDLVVSDIIERVMALDGVENVCVNRFKRLGNLFADQAQRGRIELKELEIAVCDNDPERPQDGYYRLTLHGGLPG